MLLLVSVGVKKKGERERETHAAAIAGRKGMRDHWVGACT